MSFDAHRSNVTSQHGEDGILAELLRRLGIRAGWCVEFGAWDGKHLSNTWNLWHELGWSAVLIEGDPVRAAALARDAGATGRVHVLERFVRHEGPDRLDELLRATPVPERFDVLSIDIDGDDYHVWRAVERYRARIVLVEYNPTIPATTEFVQPIGERSGASLRSLELLGEALGYRLVAATTTNAIFVDAEDAATAGIEPVRAAHVFDDALVPVVYSTYDGRHVVLRPGPWGYAGTTLPGEPLARQARRVVGSVVAAASRRWRRGR